MAPIADLHAGRSSACGGGDREPVDVAATRPVASAARPRRPPRRVARRRLHAEHVERPRRGEAQALALPDREAVDARACRPSVRPSLSTIGPRAVRRLGVRAPRTPRSRRPGTKQISWLSGLSATGRPALGRQPPHLGLPQAAHREQRAAELLLASGRTGSTTGPCRYRGPSAAAAGRSRGPRPCARSGRSRPCSIPSARVFSSRLANLTSVLQRAQGSGVRPSR